MGMSVGYYMYFLANTLYLIGASQGTINCCLLQNPQDLDEKAHNLRENPDIVWPIRAGEDHGRAVITTWYLALHAFLEESDVEC